MFRNHSHIFLTAILLLAVSTSCTKEIATDRSGTEELLDMNAQMSASDSLHSVFLCISGSNGIQEIADGTVACFINGKKVAETSAAKGPVPDRKHGSGFRQRELVFNARFSPGDLVRIEATANSGKFRASAETAVPAPPVLMSAKGIMHNDSAYGGKYVSVQLEGKEASGCTGFYRIHSSGGDVDSANDAIISDGALPDDMVLSGAGENLYNVFSDRLFDNGHFMVSFNLQDPDYDEEDGISVFIDSITKEEYSYLKALSAYEATEDDSFFNEPVIFSRNVEGGAGMVSICSPASIKVSLEKD